MPVKSTAPYQGPPSWLDPAAEQPLTLSPRYPHKPAFIDACMRALLGAGCTPQQAAEVTANACGEAAWGAACWWGNAGGWKITRAYADAFRARHGRSASWWKARGNVQSADAAWCFYRVFGSLAEFLFAWVDHFVPRPEVPAPPYPGYRAAGAAFWRGDPRWFGELILAGYKGRPSKLRMKALRLVRADDARHPSVAAHRSIAREVLEVWAQLCLGIDPDGAWGPKSRAAMARWQSTRGLPATGDLDAATVATLVLPAPLARAA